MKNKEIFLTIIMFYISWFGSVFLASTSFSLLTLLFPLGLMGFLFIKKNLSQKKLIFALMIAAIGIAFDFLLIKFEYVAISGETLLFIPTWLISIWLLYAFSMVKLGPIFNLPVWMGVILGMIMGPLSYKSGEAFHVLTFTHPTTFSSYAAFWAVMFPSVVILSKRYV